METHIANDTTDELISLPVRFEHGFVIDNEDEVVCNLLWTTHRRNWERREEAGHIIAEALNAFLAQPKTEMVKDRSTEQIKQTWREGVDAGRQAERERIAKELRERIEARRYPNTGGDINTSVNIGIDIALNIIDKLASTEGLAEGEETK